MLPISICMIGKNEEKYIEKCLKCLMPLNCEIIFVDTGSTDNTVKIVSRYTKHIYHFTWCGDFSAARNYSISKASNDWILALDCDEFLEAPEDTRLLIPEFLKKAEEQIQNVGIISLSNKYKQDSSDFISTSQAARFFSKKYCRFEGKVHEQVVTLQGEHTPRYLTPFRALHMGYYGDETVNRKAERNIPLLLDELKNGDPSPYIYYQLGKAYYSIKDYENALKYFDSGLAMDVDPALTYVQQMVENYGYTLLELKRTEEALCLEGIYDTFCIRADFVFLMGVIYMKNGRFADAIDEFKKAASFPDSDIDVYGVNSFLAYYNIGVIYECAGYISEAVSYYEKCGDYALAKNRLQYIADSANNSSK